MREFQKVEFILKVMTFNIRFGTPGNEYPQWDARKEIVISTIKKYAPTVIGTQEGFKFQLDDINDALPDYEYLGVGRDNGLEEGEYTAIFYKVDKLVPREYGNFWLSDDPYVPGSNTWGSICRRMVTWALFSSLKTGVDFYFFNTHFDFSEEIKMKSARLINKIIRKITRKNKKSPIILVGDLNCTKDSPTFKYLRRTFKDAWFASGNKYEFGTFHDFTGKPLEMIDWILYRGPIRAISTQIGTFKIDDKYPSDHFPVISELAISATNPVAQLLSLQNKAEKLGIDPMKDREKEHKKFGRELDIYEKIQVLQSEIACTQKKDVYI